MLRTNLSTRPFYNERGGARRRSARWRALAIGLTLFNAFEILRLQAPEPRRAADDRAERSAGARACATRRRSSADRSTSDEARAVQAAAREANALIDRRTFSWTELLNQFQATLPPDVRIAGVTPQSDDDGRRLVQISVFSQRIEDLEEFMDALEKTGAFSGVLPRSDQPDEDRARCDRSCRRITRRRRLRPARLPAASESGKAAPANQQRAGESPAPGRRAMKALFTFGADVPWSRVIADHRRWLMPVGVVLAINVVVLIAVVLPLRQSVQSGRRAPTHRRRRCARRWPT